MRIHTRTHTHTCACTRAVSPRSRFQHKCAHARTHAHTYASTLTRLLAHVLHGQNMWRALLSSWEACNPVEPSFSFRASGIPPRFRGRAWPFLIGNAMRISPEIFDICIGRARKLRAWQSVQSTMTRMSEYSTGAGAGSMMVEGALNRRRREDSVDSLPDLVTIGTAKLGREDTLSVRRFVLGFACGLLLAWLLARL
jgi:hypothetical protein